MHKRCWTRGNLLRWPGARQLSQTHIPVAILFDKVKVEMQLLKRARNPSWVRKQNKLRRYCRRRFVEQQPSYTRIRGAISFRSNQTSSIVRMIYVLAASQFWKPPVYGQQLHQQACRAKWVALARFERGR